MSGKTVHFRVMVGNTTYGKAEEEDFFRNVKKNPRGRKGTTVVETWRQKGQMWTVTLQNKRLYYLRQ